MSIGDAEIKTQERVINFFKSPEILGYQYLGNLSDFQNKNIKEDRLRKYLRLKGYSDKLVDAAVTRLQQEAGNFSRGIYDANKTVYSRLKYGIPVSESPEKPPVTVELIDEKEPLNNDFAIAEEVTVVEQQEKRPDLVIYLNGIAVAVIELKRSSVSVSEGIRQNLTNQKDSFIQGFFTTMQFCMAGNESEGLRYGTLLTGEKFYMEWKDDGFKEHEEERDPVDVRISATCALIEDKLLKQIYAMFDKERFIDLIMNFVVFDKGIKKVCRYNQYFGIKRTQQRLNNLRTELHNPDRDQDKPMGGILWHTQGSGKTLTMVWLAKWILTHWQELNARVLIVTDRDELDEQIEKTFTGVDENIVRTKSGKDLLNRLNAYDDSLICSLVHKFGRRGGEATENDYDKYIEELKASLPDGFETKGNLVVFVDECHRTQSGKLHMAMTTIMPNAIFIGFTGTPLLKKDKKISIEVFGTYIHAYKYNEGVTDGVVLDLRYEYRDVPQDLSSQDRVDQWFEVKTRGLSSRAKAKLKEKWGTMQQVYSSRSRLEKVAWDIIQDFNMKPRLMDGNGNAILVADSIPTACKYYEIFQQMGFKKCAIISSYTPNKGELRTDTVSDEDNTETFLKYDTYLRMLGLDPTNLPKSAGSIQAKVEEFEKEAKRKFVEEPANMKLLIVVDKLLTGFDAPPCTYLYIDKNMQDHSLFQAICRVNRLDDDSKDFGYIVDYKQLFGKLQTAMKDYTSGAFEGYDPEDIKGLVKDRHDEAISYFDEVYDAVEELCEGVEEPREDLQYIHYFCGISGQSEENDEIYARLREKLYRLVSSLVRAFAEAKPYLVDDIPSGKLNEYDKKVTFYIELKKTIGTASGDFLDLKAYEPDMRKMIDNYITASDAEKIGDFDDLTLLDFVAKQGEALAGEGDDGHKEGAAEAIENNIRRKVIEKVTVNPRYYAKMSEILDKLIEERKQGVLDYTQMLEEYIKLARDVDCPEDNDKYPESIRKSKALMAIYDNSGEDEKLALKIYKAVKKQALSGFRDNQVVVRRIKKALFEILGDDSEVERIYKIIEKQEEL